jgi:hypothetical protein
MANRFFSRCKSMQLAAPRRGRPKGTGINDADRIARLAELLRTKPELKPTTAIRLMGFSDPSAIRRLRDKYKAFASSANRPNLTDRLVRPIAAPEAPAITVLHRAS